MATRAVFLMGGDAVGSIASAKKQRRTAQAMRRKQYSGIVGAKKYRHGGNETADAHCRRRAEEYPPREIDEGRRSIVLM